MYRPSIEGAKYVFQEITIQDAFITGHHAYRVYPNVGEVLTCKMEPENRFDPSAVKVLDNTERIVGHVPATKCPLNKAIFQILTKWPGFPLEWYCNIYIYIYSCCYIVTYCYIYHVYPIQAKGDSLCVHCFQIVYTSCCNEL